MATTTPGVYPGSQDLVAILDDETLQPLFTASSPMRVAVDRTKTPTKFQVESGATRSDHVVINATEIGIDLVLTNDTRQQYAALEQAWTANRLVTVQTKVSSYRHMLIEMLPHDENVALGDSISMPIRLSEWREVQPAYGTLPMSKAANKAQSSTVARGNQQGRTTNPTIAKSVYDYITG
jgi:hypothetical protein